MDNVIEWRERGKQHWNCETGTRGKSAGELNRLLVGFQNRNSTFEFRIRPFAIGKADLPYYTEPQPLTDTDRALAIVDRALAGESEQERERR